MSQDWLHQMAPAHAPAAIGWWPPAPGWWVLAALVVLLSTAWILWLRNPRRLLRRSALRQLQKIRKSDADGTAVAQAVQNLMRRYALHVFGYDAVASLAGEAWLQFVVSQGGNALAEGPGATLLRAAYGHPDQDDRGQWFQAAERFIARAGRKRSAVGSILKRRAASPGDSTR